MKYQNAIEFVSMIPKFCNSIVDYNLYINFNSEFVKPCLDIIKFQPLERVIFSLNNVNAKDIAHQTETLKELSFRYSDLQYIDLSFMSKLECLEQLEFQLCEGFTSNHCESLFEKNFISKN